MKKLFFLATVALGMTAACQKPDVKVEEPEIDDNAPVEVKFGVNAPTLTVTKTKAAVEAWDDTEIYIYSGVVTTDQTSGTRTLNFTTPLIDNRKATVATNQTVSFPNDDTTNETYYYDVNTVYDFYGYYVDNATLTSDNEGNTVTNNGTSLTAQVTITGSQDIMLAATNIEEDVTEVSTTVNSSRIYSAYAARRGVQPTLEFKHMLSRFIFMVKKGNSNSDSKTVFVSSISVKAPTTGTLTIAPTQSFETTDSDNPITASIKVNDTNSNWHTPQDQATEACDDLFLFPGDKTIPLVVKLMAEGETDETKAYEMPIDLTPDMFDVTEFEKGKKYTLTLTVYNLEQVKVEATVATWEDGGTSEYDPDETYDTAAGTFATKVTNSSNEDVILYSKALLATDVEVFADYKMTTSATDGTYTTVTHTIKVESGKVTEYTENTAVQP